MRLALYFFAAIVAHSAAVGVAESVSEADLLLVDGAVVDGSGGEPFTADVAILGGRIVAVGPLDAPPGAERVDCRGKIVAPGFIDLHNHSDEPILEPATRGAACYLTQGCTTIVTGNCGDGAVDVAGYLAAIDRDGAGVNVAHLAPQGAIRRRVLGEVRRPATRDELAAMLAIVEESMRAGAWGLTSGLQYVPSAYADLDELAALASVVARHGGVYASHIRDEGDNLVASVEEAIEIGRRSGAAVHVSHLKASQKQNWGRIRAAAYAIESARESGLAVTADQYPYNASSTSILAMLLPDEEREGGDAATIARLLSADQGPRLRELVATSLERRGPILVASVNGHPEWVGELLTDIAAAEQRDVIDVAMDVVTAGDASGVSFSMDEADVRWAMTLPFVATASDGSSKIDDGTSPHPRSFGTFPRKIGFYALRERVLPLAAAVRSASGLPADILGMTDRGYIRPGQAADIVVFDPDEFLDTATYEKPFGVSRGVTLVLVGGKRAVVDGEATGALAGKALRKNARHPTSPSSSDAP